MTQSLRSTPARLLLLLTIIVTGWAGLRPLLAPPAAVAADAPPDTFSAMRAMQDLHEFATGPRPIGSEAAVAADEYVIAELRAMGLEPVTYQPEFAFVSPYYGFPQAGTARIVMARLPGTDPGGAVLLGAHTDTVQSGPGAADCGSCVVTVLETMRVLVAGEPLRNDVIAAFVSGEEVAMFGSRAFMQHPWADDVRLALNFEAHGLGGSSVMYVTSEGSAPLIRTLGAETTRPVAYSWLSEMVGATAGGSDLDSYVSEGAAGMGFVYFEGYDAYHSQMEQPENLDPRSIQHNGEYAVALVRHYADRPLGEAAAGAEAVYFTLLPGVFVHYPVGLAPLIAVLALAGFAAVLVAGSRTGRLTVGGSLLGALLALLAVVGAVLAVSLLWFGLRALDPDLQVYMLGMSHRSSLYLAGLVAVAVAVVSLLAALRDSVRRANAAAGALLLWVLLSLATAFLLPGASALFTWPALAMTLAMLLIVSHEAGSSGPAVAALLLAAGVTVWFAAPAVHLLSVFWGRLEATAGTPMVALPVAVAALAAALLLPALDVLNGERRSLVTVLAAGLGVIVLAVASLLPAFDAERPLARMLAYTVDADNGEAYWVTADDARLGRRSRLDPWTAQFFEGGGAEAVAQPWPFSYAEDYRALRAPAPAFDVPAAVVTVAADEVVGDERRVTLLVESDAPTVRAEFLSDAPMRGWQIGETPLALDPGNQQYMLLYPPAEGGIEVSFTTAPGTALTVQTVSRGYGLPETGAPPRPAELIPSIMETSDASIVTETFVFP